MNTKTNSLKLVDDDYESSDDERRPRRKARKNKNKLNKNWYYGTTGIEPVDFAINTAFKYGYLHHIMRLMVMGNFMNLCGIHPDEVYKWMMEFS